MSNRVSFQPSPEQQEKLKLLGRHVNLSQLMRDCLDMALAKLVLTIEKGEKTNDK